MAFEFDAQLISDVAVVLLRRSLVLPATVLNVGQANYIGSGGSVRVRIPQRRTAAEQSSAGTQINFSDIDEDTVDVVVSHLYDACFINDESLTLEIREFVNQVIRPMTAAVAEASEEVLADAMNGVTPVSAFQDLDDPDKTEIDVLAIREALTTNDVPAGDRFLAVAPSVATSMLKLDKFSRIDASGDQSALRDAVLGRIYGMVVVESNALTEDSALGYHQSAFAFATLAPAIPSGAASAAVSIEQGIALRVLLDFDINHLRDGVAVSTFGGGSLLDEDRVVRIAAES